MARNASVENVMAKICEEKGWDRDDVRTNHNPNACYCACPTGPCEHDFQGWRESEDGLTGETFCKRCGMGAMGHDMRTGP